MSDRADEQDASGVPERADGADGTDVTDSGRHGTDVTDITDITDSGRHVTDSGRHVTNRNVVPRNPGPAAPSASPGDDAADRELGDTDEAGWPRLPDDFDVDTPVRPEPRDVRDEADVTLSHGDDADGPGGREPARRLVVPVRRAPTEPGHVGPPRRPSAPRLASEPGGAADPRSRGPTRRMPRQAHVEAAPVPVPPGVDRALRGITVLAVLGLGVAGLVQPQSVLRGGIAWLGLLFFALAGWGAIAARIARADPPDFGLSAALGAAGYLAIAGPLVAAGLLTRPVILALIGAGVAGFAWREATAPVAIWHRIRDGMLFFRRRPALGAFAAVLVVLAGVRLVGAVAALDASPWDDDVAYTGFIRRLLDAGDLVEPFSFRRLGAYGGQTALGALAGARGTLANVHLIDRGLALGVAVLAMLGLARERGTQPVWLALIALVVLVLPETAVNTASYWTGLVMFLALYRLVVREHWALVGAVAAATCTLRQNFLVPVGVFVASVLIARLIGLLRELPVREAWARERRHWAWTAGVALAVIAPWWLAAQLSSGTFLFPIVDGTWNHELVLRPEVVRWPEELGLLVTCCLDSSPLVVIPILALALAFVTDHRPGRPLSSLALASAVGLVALVHGFPSSEALHIWRYAFGFAAALAIALALELGASDDARVELAPLGRWIVLAALVLQLTVERGAMARQATALVGDLRQAAAIDRRGDPGARAERRRYAAMQAAIPPGERAVVMLDDPAMLDFAKNPIANLDVPGFASPGDQLPAFRGAEALRTYLVAQGYRYAAFVRSERSRYCFRREFEIERMFSDTEIFEVMSAYSLDAIDSLAELANTTTVRYDADGLVVLDLASPVGPASLRAAPGNEPTRRTAWARELADREHLHDAWALATRADLRFEDGFGKLRFVDGSIDDPAWYELSHGYTEAARGTAVRTLLRRSHLRVRGAGARRLSLRAAIALGAVHTHPRLEVSLDGELVVSAVADAAGRYAIDVTVPGDRLAGGWHDLYLVFSSIADPEKEVRELRIARLESIEWSP